MTSHNNVFTLRRTGLLGLGPGRWDRPDGSDDTSIHPTASRPAEIVLVARLVQLRVNGRREHGNVIRNWRSSYLHILNDDTWYHHFLYRWGLLNSMSSEIH